MFDINALPLASLFDDAVSAATRPIADQLSWLPPALLASLLKDLAFLALAALIARRLCRRQNAARES